MNRPPVLYKYLDAKGAEEFLARPQLRHTAFDKLDDICDSFPAFSQLTQELSRQNAIARASRSSEKDIPFEKSVIFYEELGMLSPTYLEKLMRELISEGQGYTTCICSLVARPDSLAMWHQYAAMHRGIVFGIGSDLDRVIAGKRRFLMQVDYPADNNRPNIAFNDPKLTDIAHMFWTKGQDWSYQKEWRIISDNPETDYLECGEVKEVIFGYRYSSDKSEVMTRPLFKETEFFEAYPDSTQYQMARVRLDRTP